MCARFLSSLWNQFKADQKYQPQRLDKVLSKYLKANRTVGELEGYYNDLNKYSECNKPDKDIEDKYLKSHPNKTIAERVKLMLLKTRQKPGTVIKTLIKKKVLTRLLVILAQI